MAFNLLTAAYCMVIAGVNLVMNRPLQAGCAFAAALCFVVEAMGSDEV